ncbi:ADP-ribosylglycohydrolase family protein [Blastococcus sp. CT_GayMR16]|uniref:ADP-ribosylglycohydrolase family protein n=1 Tax=Blastococcus sp. CT_GayMR16 TaxID=2559607 RepID=UPI001FD7D2AF|nr:ADP-ribosylglycohydrolase family protein [Blastococcus sp. CT_GayMR16]
MPSMHRSHRVAGALVGSAVGDALGTPFESGPPGQFSARFPVPARGSKTEMCGSESLEPGEFTASTQQALVFAESLLERGGLDEADLADRLCTWGGDLSVGPTTSAAIWFSRFGSETTMDAARRISALTNADPAAGEAAATFHELMRAALDGDDPLASSETDVAVHRTLERALWALRKGRNFAEVMQLAIDVGDETNTVAAVAGGLAGAVFGMGGIPMRWSSAVHGRVRGFGDRRWGLAELQELAAALEGKPLVHYSPGAIPRIGPREVLPGIWAGNLDGARHSEEDFAVISLCRLGDPFPHEVHRMAYIADNDYNHDVDAVRADVLDDVAALRAEGHKVLVHCHAGASRTGLVLRAWLIRTEGMSVEEATAQVPERWPHLGVWNHSFTTTLGRLHSGIETPAPRWG